MAECKECGLTVEWRQGDGKWQCYNPDGSVHWDRCSARRFEQIKAKGKFFRKESGSGNVVAEGYKMRRRIQYTMLRPAESIKGGEYKGACDCKTPPWELCPHSFTNVHAS